MGIALVVPATQILETINHPELAELRRKVHEASQVGSEPTLDNMAPGITDEEATQQRTPQGLSVPIPLRDDFLKDLAKATRRKKPSD